MPFFFLSIPKMTQKKKVTKCSKNPIQESIPTMSNSRITQNFPAINARSVMKMAAEELMADEPFVTLRSLYFDVWENIS